MLTGFVEQSPQCSTRCCEPFPSPSICQVKTKIFESAVLVTIVANVVLLLAEHFPSATSWATFLELLNTIFLVVFTIEIVMQILALGAGPYLKNNWNRLDVGIVVLSWAFTFGGVAVGVQAGRAVRMLRVLLVLKSAMTVRSIVMTLIVSIAPAANVFASVRPSLPHWD